jgi:hypothetical protein
MDKAKASLTGERTLWSLYRKTVAAERLVRELGTGARSKANVGSAVAAALAEVLGASDWAALPPDELSLRCTLGTGASALLGGTGRRAKREPLSPAFAGDGRLRVLPGEAGVALGAATVLRAQHAGGCVVLLRREERRGPAAGLRTGLWASAAQVASERKLPLVFVVDREGAGPSKNEAGPRRAAPAMPVIPVEREDALALYRVFSESCAHAREGSGPTWVECCEARLPDGSTLDGERGALERIQAALKARKLWSRERARALEAAVEREFKVD